MTERPRHRDRSVARPLRGLAAQPLRPPAARARARRRRLGVGRRRPPLPRPRRRHRGQRAGPQPPRARRGRLQAGRPARARVELLHLDAAGRARRAAAARSPARPQGSTVFFCNSGTEALEAAIKLARRTGRTGIVAAEGAFHGRTHRSPRAHPQAGLPRAVRAAHPGRHATCRGATSTPCAPPSPSRPRRSSSSRSRARRACGPAARPTCARPATSPARSARCSCSTRCRPASAAPARGSRSTRPASCPTR